MELSQDPDRLPGTMGEAAVCVQDASKAYGIGKRRSNVLNSLNLIVKNGTIYGLLGASGCGKTTLLSCIVGRRSLDSGKISVFGGEPGTKESGIPGPRVGYMPQELALYGEFTIKETLEYFGRIYKLPNAYVKSQTEFLTKLLDLPPGHRFVRTLSGGQQRRVSFAVALFHDPELLILDEPTVGVDPVLRQSIWSHLLRLSAVHGRTVIITTHYIEEASQAHKVGMMRSGSLLAEDPPQCLLDKHNLVSLEDVFLKLCMKQQVDDGDLSIVPSSTNNTSTNSNIAQLTTSKQTENRSFKLNPPSPQRTLALLHKNLLQIFRNVGIFVFMFILPVMQTAIFCLAIGHDPTSLQIAVVNEELNPNQGRTCSYKTDCSHSMLSCRFLRSINNESIIQVPYSNYDEAIDATQNGKLKGVIHFGKNFTNDLKAREIEGPNAANETIIGSLINVYLDRTNQQTAYMLERRFVEAFQNFNKDFLKSCSKEEEAANIPLTFLEPIYGSKDTSLADFMASGLILSIVYFMAVALTTATFVIERKQGLLDRILVAGVQTSEIMLAHVISQFTILVGQAALVFIFMLFVFNTTCIGSIPLSVLITLLQGLCGMTFGFLISAICDEESSAIHMALGSFYPDVLLSGALWPIEGMPVFMRYIAYSLPQTYAIESLRSVFARGWGIERPEVYIGILITCGWIAAFIILSLVVLRVRKYTG